MDEAEKLYAEDEAFEEKQKRLNLSDEPKALTPEEE
jgi:hypothetical protein